MSEQWFSLFDKQGDKQYDKQYDKQGRMALVTVDEDENVVVDYYSDTNNSGSSNDDTVIDYGSSVLLVPPVLPNQVLVWDETINALTNKTVNRSWGVE